MVGRLRCPPKALCAWAGRVSTGGECRLTVDCRQPRLQNDALQTSKGWSIVGVSQQDLGDKLLSARGLLGHSCLLLVGRGTGERDSTTGGG